MLTTALLIVTLCPLTSVSSEARAAAGPPLAVAPGGARTDTAPAAVQRTLRPERQWIAPIGRLRGAPLRNVGTVGDLLLVEDERMGLTCLQPATGEARWFVQLPQPLSAWPVPGDTRLALACGQDVVVVSSATGSRQHTLATASVPANSPTADEHAVYVPALLGDEVVATDLRTGQVAWSYQLASPITTPAQLIGPQGTRSVLVGCEDGYLRALPTGLPVPARERWVTHVGSIIERPVPAGERVLVASRDLALRALDASSGSVLWKHLPGEHLRGIPVPAGEVVACATDTRLFAVNAADGQLAWEAAVSARPLAELDGALLVRLADGTTELREAATGKLLVPSLPAHVLSSHGMLVQLRDRTDIVAWKLDG